MAAGVPERVPGPAVLLIRLGVQNARHQAGPAASPRPECTAHGSADPGTSRPCGFADYPAEGQQADSAGGYILDRTAPARYEARVAGRERTDLSTAGEEQPMCDTGNRADVTPADALPANVEWKGETLPLEPVDELSILTVCHNVVDMLLPDEGPAKRLPLAGMSRQVPMPPRAGGRRLRHHRAAAAIVPLRPVGTDHRGSGPGHHV